MSTKILRVLALLPALTLSASSVRAQEVRFAGAAAPALGVKSSASLMDAGFVSISDEGEAAEDAEPESAADAAESAGASGTGCSACGDGSCSCGQGDDCCDGCLDDCCDDCEDGCGLGLGLLDCWTGSDDCGDRGFVLFTGVDSWRGFSDGTFQDNSGGHAGINYGTRLGRLTDEYGIGAQLGMSYGVYDMNGRTSGVDPLNESAEEQTQVFVTAGMFRKADEYSRVSAGLAYDWMINDNFGVFSTEPFIGQWRGQLAYALSDTDEVGVWAAVRDRGDTQVVGPAAVALSYRGVSQANLFWHHKWELGADTWAWAGLPDDEKLGPNGGSLGSVLLGGALNVPLNDRVSTYANVQYMDPSAQMGPAGSFEGSWNLSLGIAFYPGNNSRTRTVAGSRWMPYLPVANNGSFLVDTNITQ